MNLFLLAALVRIAWNASVQPPSVDHYQVCIVGNGADRCENVSGSPYIVELDSLKDWSVNVVAVNRDGSSIPVKEVVVPKNVIVQTGCGVPDSDIWNLADPFRQLWRLHWAASLKTINERNARIERILKVCGKKCSHVP